VDSTCRDGESIELMIGLLTGTPDYTQPR